MKRRAFTLIELLVVIAIIAILAAILFPVFAQAKAAAKASASLSNSKQLTLGSIMYSGDSDDVIVPEALFNTGHDGLYSGANGFSTWGWLCAPYVKSGALYGDPSGPGQGLSGTQQIANYQTFYSNYGMNGTYLTDVEGSPQAPHPVSATSAAAPAETVYIGAKYSKSENTTGNIWGTGFPPSNSGLLSDAEIDPPDCYSCVPYCLDGWGTGTFYEGTLKLSEAAGGRTGGLALRVGGNAVVSFIDGHSKSMKPGALMAGTNASRTSPSSGVVITDINKYLWDLK